MPAGTSKIELILEDCVVQENWKSMASPYSGKSYNIYDAALKRWEQYWVDNVGGNIFFHGELSKDGVMDYWTDDIPQSGGPALRRHLQFIPMGADKVRQFSRGSTDGGKTWNVEYDFTYIRKAKSGTDCEDQLSVGAPGAASPRPTKCALVCSSCGGLRGVRQNR